MNILMQRVIQALSLTNDFYETIEEHCLRFAIPDVPSNTIGEQAYCIIGARESYLKALKAGQWNGFECSLTDSHNKILLINKLKETHTNIEKYLQEVSIDNVNNNLLIDLLEHEVQHHGQLIRYAYANKIGFPKSWNARYTV
ncbi:hypothetical protein [Ornithinibacillus halophilus]|uniref:DinB family protein n=1 Tax=Ornithinibacillus halophilus TaxID=930117 RepID=A0A1M5KUL3_9BACI|nr:hypothetical protein [Ornithinibacillus halophilus]SHG56426.1 hypothetical protein SAMN05216225_104124 [Ornithinibacillus halophilus]